MAVAGVISSITTVALITGVIPDFAAACAGVRHRGLSFYTVAVVEAPTPVNSGGGCRGLVKVALQG